MNYWDVFSRACGYEMVRGHLRLYTEGPGAMPDFTRERGVRTPLFHLYAGVDAERLLVWLAMNRAWQALRIPPKFTLELGVKGVLAATEWHCGDGTGLCRLARLRVIEDDAHRECLRREVRHLLGMVLENPVQDGEFKQLQNLEDAVNSAPLGIELATLGEVVDRQFGRRG